MSGRWTVAIVLVLAVRACGAVYSYECNSFPDDAGWYVGQNWCDTQEWVEAGRFYQHVEFCPGYDPPQGQQSSYRHSLDEFVGSDAFFVEWRMQTDGHRSEIPFGAPALLSAWSAGSVLYHFVIAADQIRFLRDNLLPIVWADVAPGVEHVYRLETYADDLYLFYIDGSVIDAGVPEDPYPSAGPGVIFRAKAQFVESTTIWYYIRWGDIPADASADFDSDDDGDLFDFYFFHECLSGGAPGDDAGPGCRFADMDSDTDVDLHDFALFQNAFRGGE